MTVLISTLESLKAKRTQELQRLRAGLYQACDAQATVDVLTRQIDELALIVAAEPMQHQVAA